MSCRRYASSASLAAAFSIALFAMSHAYARCAVEAFDVRFDHGSADLSDDAKAAIDREIAFIPKWDAASITVIGRADGIEAAGDARGLSSQRAAAVAAYLRERSVDTIPSKLYAAGSDQPLGGHPLDAASDPKLQARNRSVVVVNNPCQQCVDMIYTEIPRPAASRAPD